MICRIQQIYCIRRYLNKTFLSRVYYTFLREQLVANAAIYITIYCSNYILLIPYLYKILCYKSINVV